MKLECIRCNSERIIQVSGKTSDCYGHTLQGKNYEGYVPFNIGIGGGDYIEFTYCLDCGQIQGDFPAGDPEDNEEFIEDEN